MNLKDKWPWLLLAAAVFLSSLYEYGYWSTFHFNAFEYFTVESLIKNFAYVVLSGISPASLFPLFIGLPQFVKELRSINPDTKDAGRQPSDYEELVREYPRVFRCIGLTAVAVMAYCVYGFLSSSAWLYDWHFITFLISTSVFLSLTKDLASFGTAWMRLFASYYTIFYIWVAFSTGRSDALIILRGQGTFLVSFSEAEQKDIGHKTAKYLGNLGDSYVFMALDNQQTFIVRRDHLPTLRLKNSRTLGLPRR